MVRNVVYTSKMYKQLASREGSLSAFAIASSIAAASISSTQKQEKKYDAFDHILQPLRKAAEFKNLLSQLSTSSQGIPILASSYAAYNRLSSAFSNPAYSQPFVFNDDEWEILSYHGYTCGSYLTNHPLAIYTRKQPELAQQKQQQLIPAEHKCDPQRLISCSSLPTETKNKIIVDLHYKLPESITKAVNGWTKNRSCLLSFEIPNNIQKGYPIDLIPKYENHWSTRATKKRQTVFNNAEELKNFICSANNATFGIFTVHLQSQQKDSKSTYFLFVSPIDTEVP